MIGLLTKKRIKALVRQSMKKGGIFLMIISTVFYSFGGIDLYLGWVTPFHPQTAGAAYTGKTIEYGRDNHKKYSSFLHTLPRQRFYALFLKETNHHTPRSLLPVPSPSVFEVVDVAVLVVTGSAA